MFNLIFSGFRFGTILQIAIGPICLFIFQTAASSGFAAGAAAAVGVTLADFFYVVAAIWGVGSFIERSDRIRTYFKYFGSIVLVLFGASTLLSVFDINIVPGLNLQSEQKSGSAFINALFLTLSSPLTIVFWAGVFSAKIADVGMSRTDIYLFGFGAILSTLVFMSLTAWIGTVTSSFMPEALIRVLNIVVGTMLIYFGIRTALKK